MGPAKKNCCLDHMSTKVVGIIAVMALLGYVAAMLTISTIKEHEAKRKK